MYLVRWNSCTAVERSSNARRKVYGIQLDCSPVITAPQIQVHCFCQLCENGFGLFKYFPLIAVTMLIKLCSQKMLQRQCRRKRALLLIPVCLLDTGFHGMRGSLQQQTLASPSSSSYNTCCQQHSGASSSPSKHLGQFCSGLLPVRHLPINSLPRHHPRADFQQVLSVQH